MTAYISASTNRHPHAADISSASLVAFASDTLVCLWNSAADGGVSKTLAAHEGLITCVRFLNDQLLATADDKGILRCWRHAGAQWTSTAKVDAHKQAISSLCVHDECLTTASSDGTVKIWKFGPSDELEQVQALSLNGRYALALAMTILPRSNVEILAVAGTDRNIQIWTRSGAMFVRAAVLSGHEDWVRCLAFQNPPTADEPLVLASGSQDGTIRLWRIEAFTKINNPDPSDMPTDALNDDLLDAFEVSLGDLADAEEGGRQISLKHHILTVKSDQASPQQYSITFDALLIGHEAGVTGLSWRPIGAAEPTLLSTSTDSSLILWSPTSIRSSSEDNSTIWTSRQRFGDVGGQRLGGFVGGLWAGNGNETLGWGWSGGWRRWRCTSTGERQIDETWGEVSAITGHSGPVKSVDWSPDGAYLISAGLDQTTRIHCPIRRPDGSGFWQELSRPQVHGYDMLGVTFLGPLKFASIADEKVVRVFEAPRGFVDLAEKLGVAVFSEEQHSRPVAASVPPLGLSNKAVNEAVIPAGDSSISTRPPFEGELASTTLWPEIEKIFGHGYESMSLAVSGSRRLIATACKASTAEHAVVRVYSTDNWQPVGDPLSGHTLTVTRIAFSPDDRLVLTVSRDRTWRLYEAQTSGGYLPVAADKSHGRIIWDCAWAAEGDIFATASRDKTVKIWHRAPDAKWTPVQVIKTTEAATAVDFSALDDQNRRYLAIGLETGAIVVYSVTSWQLEHTWLGHVGHIHRLSWRPGFRELATCSEDRTVRILRF